MCTLLRESMKIKNRHVVPLFVVIGVNCWFLLWKYLRCYFKSKYFNSTKILYAIQHDGKLVIIFESNIEDSLSFFSSFIHAEFIAK